ncbi:MAG: UDP-N-acetylmuramoyl-L-alanine--D-glutamate ligase, partial [Flavobacteriaceae bacterium]|nr:UDP-N-acetylmuramoyl-L-alanine--D-glutamate ligase [Flavobacteriaceae bacterium]
MKKLVVLGAGESGIGTAVLGKRQGYKVFVSDYGQVKEKYKNVLIHHEIEWEEGRHSESRILEADLVMKSPGIPDKVPIVEALVNKGVPVISEIEFASFFTDATIVGITGSNGKTTTTMLTNYILKNGGLKVDMAGNIGDSYAMSVSEGSFDYYVLEISSFQLDGIESFRPHIAVITNITPDHLDRYEYKFENYVESKFRIAMNQTSKDYLIYDADDPVIMEYLENHNIQSTLIPFSLFDELEYGVYYRNKDIHIKIDNSEITMPTTNLSLEGKHNIKNAMAASAVAQILNIRS